MAGARVEGPWARAFSELDASAAAGDAGTRVRHLMRGFKLSVIAHIEADLPRVLASVCVRAQCRRLRCRCVRCGGA